MHRPVSEMTLVAAGLLLALAGCSEETPPEFAANTYGGQHRAQIEVDCDKRVQCAERTNPFLREDAFEDCSSQTAQILNAHPEVRLKFQLGINRCTLPDVCRYAQCADSPFVSFGETQIDKVNYSCTQKVQCQIDSAMIAGNPQAIFDSCVIASVLALDTYPSEAQATYQQSFFPCMPMMSCAFTTCFPY
jgi:hypothetical protein